MALADALIRKLSAYHRLDPRELHAMHDLPVRSQRIEARQVIVREGDRPTESMLIADGITFRSKVTAEGERQILALHIAGEIPDLQTLYLPVLDHDLIALTPCEVGFVSHVDLREVIRANPGLGSALWRETLIDTAISREWLFNVGRRLAPQGLAHLVLELKHRMVAIGRAEPTGSFTFPIAQTELAECLGITSVHLSRALNRLRELGLLNIERHRFDLPDEQALIDFASFDATYLHVPR